MQSHVSKWGNSLGVRLPRSMAETLGIHEGDPIELHINHDHISIHKKVYHLESLLKQVSKENLHKEIDTGLAKGHEIW
jgi:antitoxin MazE